MHPQKSHWDIKILKISKLHISNLLIVAFFPILILFPWYTCSSVEGAVYSEHLSLYWVHLVKCQGWPLSDKTCDKPCVNIFTHDFGQQRVVYIHKKILHINLLFNSFWSTDHRLHDDTIIFTINIAFHCTSWPKTMDSLFPIWMYTNPLNIFTGTKNLKKLHSYI